MDQFSSKFRNLDNTVVICGNFNDDILQEKINQYKIVNSTNEFKEIVNSTTGICATRDSVLDHVMLKNVHALALQIIENQCFIDNYSIINWHLLDASACIGD